MVFATLFATVQHYGKNGNHFPHIIATL